MKILVVGGTGLIGGHGALYFKEQEHDVTIMARSKPKGTSALNELPFIAGNYVEDDFSDGRLNGFDWLVFAAGNDIRHLPEGSDETEHYTKTNVEAIPRFFEKAREAGITRTVYIGSFYPQVVPEKIETSAYVKSRFLSDQAVRALSTPDFNVCSLNAPIVVGSLPGLSVPHLEALVQYAKGQIPGFPVFAPEGGTNHITVKSLSEAMLSALERGQSGKAYLVGDENLTWKDYLEEFFRGVGQETELEIRDEEHPMFPDMILFAGRGATVSYEPDAEETALLGYSRNNVKQAIQEIVSLGLAQK
jgi:nucleoside-diphosphate-sugar epimerase